MALSAEDTARLAELKAARDKLLKGEAVASISSAGRSVSLTPADKDALNAEIDRLEAAAAGNAIPVKRGAMRFIW